MTCCGYLTPRNSRPTSLKAAVLQVASASRRSHSSAPVLETPSSRLLENACASSPFNLTRCHRDAGLKRSTIRRLRISLHCHCDPTDNDLAKLRASSCSQWQAYLHSILRCLP